MMKFPWTSTKPLVDSVKPGILELPTIEAKPVQKRVLLVFPVFDNVKPEAFECFTRLLVNAPRYCPEYKFDPMVITRMSLTGAMNSAVAQIMKYGDYEYMISFDDDCIPSLADFPLNDPHRYQVIPRLLGLGGLGHKIVMGVGYMKGFPHTITMARRYPWGASLVSCGADDGGDAYKGFFWFADLESHKEEMDENGLIDVDWAGVPVMMVHRSVFEALKVPYFATTDGIAEMTHDVYFCMKAKAAGFAIKVDSHIDCGHIIHAPVVNRETVADLRKMMELKRLSAIPVLQENSPVAIG